jgi:hypothetical protein
MVLMRAQRAEKNRRVVRLITLIGGIRVIPIGQKNTNLVIDVNTFTEISYQIPPLQE